MNVLPDLPVAYLGPDTMLPVASTIGAIIGAVLICWRWILATLGSAFRFVTGRGRRSPESQEESTCPTQGE